MSLSALVALTLGQTIINGTNIFAQPQWGQYGGNAQHTALSQVASKPLTGLLWQGPNPYWSGPFPIDFAPQYSGGELLAHYGTPLVTTKGTLILPIKTGASDGFEFVGLTTDGLIKWILGTDYTLPPHGWTPSCAGALQLGNYWLAVPGAAGTLYILTNPDNPTANPVQVAWYGLANYTGASTMDKALIVSNVKICTPLMTASDSHIYYGVRTITPNPLNNLKSGFVQTWATAMGGNYLKASTIAGDPNMVAPVQNCTPALSNDGKIVYFVVSSGDFGYGYLVAVDTHSFTPIAAVRLKDPDGLDAQLPDNGTASPMVGPDGDVYFGVLENPFPYNHDRGWMLHYSYNLKVKKTPGPFGWDDTASVVPSKAVPSYHGTSPYLILTKYNNYAGVGGDGHNKVGIFDPNSTQVDPITGATVMKDVISVTGVTPDGEFGGSTVREWCINSAAVDPFNKCAILNSEDGSCYRWNFVTNTLDQSISLTGGVGEAYTPTVIGTNGSVYAINNAQLFAIGIPFVH